MWNRPGAVLILLAALGACGGDAPPAAGTSAAAAEGTGDAARAFAGLPFYPGSEDKVPGVAPQEGIPSVRLTDDSIDVVAQYYRERLSDLSERTIGGDIVLGGFTQESKVDVTVGKFEGRTQIMISKR
jgi:hypothetical protein